LRDEMTNANEVTRLLELVRNGDTDALNRLIPIVYGELRQLAHLQRHRQGQNETLNTTALVHEVYEKLARGSSTFADRQHFFRVAARAMRSVLVDQARAQKRQKRGGGVHAEPLDESLLVPAEGAEHMVALDDALARLEKLDNRQAEVVELRYFVGLTIPETADVLGLSMATVKRDWLAARAWLQLVLSESGEHG
jgi:RNA polymerase sigma factor (TIGR02999 family)